MSQLEFSRPDEEAERRALMWLKDEQQHGSPLTRHFASTLIELLAHFEEQVTALDKTDKLT